MVENIKQNKLKMKGNKCRIASIILLMLMGVATISDLSNYRESSFAFISWLVLCVALVTMVIALILKSNGKFLFISECIFALYTILGVVEVYMEHGSKHDLVASYAYIFLLIPILIITALGMKDSVRNKKAFGYLWIFQAIASLADIVITLYIINSLSNFVLTSDEIVAMIISLVIISILPSGLFLACLWIIKSKCCLTEEKTDTESIEEILKEFSEETNEV